MTFRALVTVAGISLFSATSSSAATIGYTYTVVHAEFSTIQAPSLAAVNDPDGYIISVPSQVDMTLLGGQILDVSSFGTSQFTVSGIDPDLMLDPDDPFAFPLGVTLQNITGLGVIVTPQPITMTPVPLPAGGLLLLSGFGGFVAFQRRKKQAA